MTGERATFAFLTSVTYLHKADTDVTPHGAHPEVTERQRRDAAALSKAGTTTGEHQGTWALEAPGYHTPHNWPRATLCTVLSALFSGVLCPEGKRGVVTNELLAEQLGSQ